MLHMWEKRPPEKGLPQAERQWQSLKESRVSFTSVFGQLARIGQKNDRAILE